jgi:IS5 family transposase
MSQKARFHRTDKGSFFGDLVYDRIIPQDHFLVALDRLFDWQAISAELIGAYQGKGIRGRAPYEPALIFKMLFISYLYNVSERQVEQLVNYHIVIKWFVGLAVDEAAPDHSSLTKFKNRFLSYGQWQRLKRIFNQVIRQAMEQGIEMGQLQIVDSVHTCADVNLDKDEKRQKQGKLPRDTDARVVNKGERVVVDADGKRRKKKLRYKGYKTHVSLNAQTGIVTSTLPSLGNKADNKAFPDLLADDQALELPTTIYGGDKAYDDTDIYSRLEEKGLQIGIHLRKFRTEKKDANKERWITLEATPSYQQATAQRYCVEQPFGPIKQKHGFGRCRYLGLARYRIQSFFTFLLSDCKRIIKLLTGLTFRPQSKGRRAEVFQPVYATLPWV